MKLVCQEKEQCKNRAGCYFEKNYQLVIGSPAPAYNIFPMCTCNTCERKDCVYRGSPDSVKGACKLEMAYSNIEGNLGDCNDCKALKVSVRVHECKKEGLL